MSSNAPRVDRANSLSKAVDLGGLYCFFILGHLGERKSSTELSFHENEIWVSWCFKGWIFCSHLSFSWQYKFQLKMLKNPHWRCIRSAWKAVWSWVLSVFIVWFLSNCWKRFWWTKDEEKVATIKNQSLGTVEKYLWSTCSVSSCCHQQGLQLQFLWNAVVADGSEGSWSLPLVLHHHYFSWLLSQVLKVGRWCSWPCHRSSVLSAPICTKTRWVLIILNLRKLFQYGEKTAQCPAAILGSQDCSKCTGAFPKCSACLSLL